MQIGLRHIRSLSLLGRESALEKFREKRPETSPNQILSPVHAGLKVHSLARFRINFGNQYYFFTVFALRNCANTRGYKLFFFAGNENLQSMGTLNKFLSRK